MPRARWKGLFCDSSVVRLSQRILNRGGASTQISPVKIWSRRSAILPEFLGMKFEVHNGKEFIPIEIKRDMIGHKFGEFSFTRKFPTFPEKAVGPIQAAKPAGGAAQQPKK